MEKDKENHKKQIGLYIKSELLSRLSKKETVILFQMLRIVRSLRFWMYIHVKLPKEDNSIFQINNQFEILFVLISIYKESTKEFSKHLFSDLRSMDLSVEIKQRLLEYNNWLLTWEEDTFLKVVDNIRNCLCFHLDRKIYNKYIKEGSTSKDLLFGIAVGQRFIDILYTEPSTFELNFIADVVPDSVAEGQDKIDWIWNETVSQSTKFMKLINDVIGEIVKDNAYRKDLDI